MRSSVRSYISELSKFLWVSPQLRRDIIDEVTDHCRLQGTYGNSIDDPTAHFGDPRVFADTLNGTHIPFYRFFRSRLWIPFTVFAFALFRFTALAFASQEFTHEMILLLEITGPVIVALCIASGLRYQLSWDRSARFSHVFPLVIFVQVTASFSFALLHFLTLNTSLFFITIVGCVKIALYLIIFPLFFQAQRKRGMEALRYE